jgi:hypothetical protein
MPLLLEAYLQQLDTRILYLCGCIGLCHGGTLPAIVLRDCLAFTLTQGYRWHQHLS